MDMSQIYSGTASLGSIALKRLDADSSDALSRDEVAGMPQFEEAFRRADTDDSRTLDAAEIDAQVDTHRRRDSRPEGLNQAIFAALVGTASDRSARA